jgi:diguanylate cyclase (GGDEF)-like protein
VPNILLVEDCEDDAALLQAELDRLAQPFRFRRVECANEMNAALEEERFDMVISDHRLPRFDSLGALQALQRSRQRIPFIIVSGAMAETEAARAMRLGARDFIGKSDRARLLRVVERELSHARMLKERAGVERRLVRLAFHDALTGLPNARLLTPLIERSLRAPAPRRAALAVLDLDRFMRINETYGHEAGDAVLRKVGARLAARLQRDALIAHLGQDRFAIYFPCMASDDDALARAGGLRDLLDAPIEASGEEIFLSCSVGVALVPEDARDAAALLRRAESAMFEAKRQGPASVRRYSKPAGGGPAQTLRLESALRHAVERGELFLQYQPCVDAASQRLVGTEALVRWRHPRLGVLAPDRFIALADETGIIVDIGRHVLAAACGQNRAWQASALGTPSVSVNVSPAQFCKPHFAADVAVALKETGLAPDRLVLEITESTVMRDAEATIGTLRRLKNMGVTLSVDDFGTGYSSLSYLKRFPIDVLKIDRSFVAGVPDDADSRAIVRTIIALAKSLKLVVVAEGVETSAQLQYLHASGCDWAQGYLFGRPRDPESLLAASSATCADDAAGGA